MRIVFIVCLAWMLHGSLHAVRPDHSIKGKEYVGQIYACLNIVNKICAEHAITYWACGGGLLGAVRHGGFIPWDFDLDLEVSQQDYEKILSLGAVFAQYNIYFGHVNRAFARIHRDFYVNGKKQSAFIEFYPTYRSGDIVKLMYTKLSKQYKKSFWPIADLEVLSRVPFGPVFLMIPQNPQVYLERYYGHTVLTKANFPYDHVTEFLPAEYTWPADMETTIY